MTIFGICGQPASGKDTVADFFIAKGFAHISLSDILREAMRKEGLPLDREHMNAFSLKAKKERGLDYLAVAAVEKITGNTIISSIRGSSEVAYFKRSFGPSFKLLAVEAPLQSRYERAKKRNRPGDDISFETFKAQEDREKADPTGSHEVDKVISMADIVLDNGGSMDELKAQLEKFL